MTVARVSLAEIVAHLDRDLRIAEVPDEAHALNGLQVENGGEVALVVAAVDASQATIDGVVARVRDAGPALLLVHHGLFWDGHRPATGRRYRRLKALLDHDVAVYAAHIPLDVHAEFGNNALLARALGLEAPEPFDDYHGIPLGLKGRLAVDRDELRRRLDALLGTRTLLIPGGPATTSCVGVITGGAGSRVLAARAAGCDTFVTGEGAHHTYFDAMESGVNVLYAGHYATETLGVQALARHVGERFGLPWEFHDHPTGL